MCIRAALACAIFVCATNCSPTVYKYNDNKVLEADLVPVSSTVIPLPVYQVTYGLNVVPFLKDEKTKRPDGPVSLVTVNSRKKAVEQNKPKSHDISSVKEISKKEFSN